MNSSRWLGAVLTFVVAVGPALAGGWRLTDAYHRTNIGLHGTIVDHTDHHGSDRRMWSPALNKCRDLYVYLPPCYDPNRSYPIMIWLHGFMQDENAFLRTMVKPLDAAMSCGRLPPMIIAIPDGTISGRIRYLEGNSFFLNSKAGNFEDYIIEDVWDFMVANYRILPEREAHVLAGISMGGFAAFNQAIKHQDKFKIALGVYAPLNLRWLDCHGRYMGNFDPACWGWRESVDRGREVVGIFYGGVVRVRLKRLVDPIFGTGPEAVAMLSKENPIEMLDHYCVQDGKLDFYIGYGGKDEFNIDAQVESFLFHARELGITVSVGYEPRGRHNQRTAAKLVPAAIDWLAERLAPYGTAPLHIAPVLHTP